MVPLIAHLAAVTMSCFSTKLQALQLLFPKSASGIARALPSHSCYTSLNFRTRNVGLWCRFQTTVNPFQWCRVGKHKLCTYWAGMSKSRWAGTLSYPKTTDLSGSIFSLPVPESHWKTDTVFITPAVTEENIWWVIFAIVKFCPRWPHTWRYPLYSLSGPTMTSGQLG